MGNVLPDLVHPLGPPRLRARHAAERPGELARGARLHFATDRAFHGAPAFAEATAEVSQMLRAAPFSAPPRRVFFLAHVFVELALDAALLKETDGQIAAHFYAQFEAADLDGVAAETGAWLGQPLSGLADRLRAFVHARYLFDYATSDGLAGALGGLCRRAGLGDFAATDADHAVLAGLFGAWAGRAAQYEPRLVSAPRPPEW